MTRKVFIDANVPMFAAGSDDPRKAPCIAFLNKVAQGKVRGVTSAEVFQELLHRYLAGKDIAKGLAAYDHLRRLIHEAYSVDIEDVDRARKLAVEYPGATARDLLHVAVMERNGITQIVSYDKDFDVFQEVQRVQPDAL